MSRTTTSKPRQSASSTIEAAAPANSMNSRTAEKRLGELRARWLEISDLGYAGAVLGWDQATYMPTQGAAARGRQRAMLSKLAHERLVDPALGRLIDGLRKHASNLPGDSDAACLVRAAHREYQRAVKVPAEFVARRSAYGSVSYNAWTRARAANDFATMRPHLERAVDLSREYANFFAPFDYITDPLIDESDEGMTTASVRALFADLRRELVPLAKAICDQPAADDTCLRGPFPEAPQLDFSVLAIQRIGYDMTRGRMDKTHHPFCTKFSDGDVRITTRVRENDLGEALFSCLHEAGHALYEQGVSSALVGTPLGHGVSAGVHESQSRLWENIVGRSRGFWEHFYPVIRSAFPDQLGAVPLDTFYRAINKVQRSLIRTDADEVTYNLHVMLRFDLESELLEGRLAVKDLPEAWRARMLSDLGVAPLDDKDGCLQDVHWYGGWIGGGFQGYTIGNILAAQFYEAAVKAHPQIPRQTATGDFATLGTWLRETIYQHGAKFPPTEVVQRATGTPLRIAPYIAYLKGKYGELYRLPRD